MNLPQREALNQMQVDTLLRTVNQMTGTLAHTNIPADEGDGPRYPEAAIAAENSLINACDRLDKILADDSRWDMDSVKKIEANLLQLLETRNAVEALGMLPHVRYKPVIMRVPDGWVAVYGDPAFLDKSVVGYGETPEKALKCFDLLFNGEAPEGLIDWLTKHTTNENKQVDGQGNSTTPSDAGGQQTDVGNSGIVGADSPLG